jgi:acetyl-CoA carboxylase biotin carboxyl carrier protein
MDYAKEIKELINLMQEYGLIEVEIEKEGMKIRLKKSSPLEVGQVLVDSKVVEKKPQNSPQNTQSAEEIQIKSQFTQIQSPMIGTFYRAPHPDAAPFVDKGQIIEPGQVICVIEAMKLMNEIKAELKGKIVDILVNNGDPVEFGQPLFLIEKA